MEDWNHERVSAARARGDGHAVDLFPHDGALVDVQNRQRGHRRQRLAAGQQLLDRLLARRHARRIILPIDLTMIACDLTKPSNGASNWRQ